MKDLRERIEFLVKATPAKGVHNKALIAAYQHVVKMMPKEQELSNLQAIDTMVKEDKDVSLTNTVVEVKKSKQGGLITFGVDSNMFNLIANDFMSSETTKYIVFAMVVNNEEMQGIIKA